MKYLRIFIFTLVVFYFSNYLFYLFNFTNFLIVNELIFVNDPLLNFALLSVYFILILTFQTIVYYKYLIRLKNKYYMFINNLIHVIFSLFFIKFILKNEKMMLLENNLTLIFTLFLTTYIFYYSIYQKTLLKYNGNKN